MKVPPEITYRDVDKTAAIDTLIHEKIAKLERLCDYISSCHIAIEKAHDRPKSGSPYRVRIDLTLPPSHELVADSNPAESNQYVELDTVVRDAFSKIERQLKEQTRQQRESEKTKSGSATDTTALVVRLFQADGYGFLKSLDGEEIYFHRNSVLHDDFDRLEVGTGVRFEAEEGEQGPQATTVQIVDKPGANVGKSDQTLIEPPLGWEE
jgi:ribosomal subunit interface protein